MTASLLHVRNLLKCLRLLGQDILKPAIVTSCAKFSNTAGAKGDAFPTFSDMIVFRRDQAKRSVLVELESEKCAEEVVRICENFGTVKSHIVFNPVPNSQKSVCLVELETEAQLKTLFKNCKNCEEEVNHVFSRILLCNKEGKRSLLDLEKGDCLQIYRHPNADSILYDLNSFDSATKQIKMLYQKECLPDFGFRIRFLVCTQVEDSLQSLFPQCQVLPFGSSVNGFGRYNCDLDVIVDLDHLPGPKEGFMFKTSNKLLSNQRDRCQITLNFLGDMIQNFFPGVTSCLKILDASVPILKIYHSTTGLDCDISMCNSTGFYMSELLYLFGELDDRVRPLVFAIRRWAKCQGLTQDIPGPFLTNFSLTLMVIFFLQCQVPPVVPSVEVLQKLAGPSDNHDSDSVSCSFQRNISKIPKSTNKDDLGTLFINFFLFYEKISLADSALSLVSADVCKKPNRNSLFIQNPLELDLNVSKNVSRKESNKFKSALINALITSDEHFHISGILKFLVHPVSANNSSSQRKVLKHFQLDSLFNEDRPEQNLPDIPVRLSEASVSHSEDDLKSDAVQEIQHDVELQDSPEVNTEEKQNPHMVNNSSNETSQIEQKLHSHNRDNIRRVTAEDNERVTSEDSERQSETRTTDEEVHTKGNSSAKNNVVKKNTSFNYSERNNANSLSTRRGPTKQTFTFGVQSLFIESKASTAKEISIHVKTPAKHIVQKRNTLNRVFTKKQRKTPTTVEDVLSKFL